MDMQAQKLYTDLAEYFDSIVSSTADTVAEVDFLEELLKKYAAKSVLDVACGTGRHSINLARKGFNVVGVDYSANLISIARSKAEGLNVDFDVQDVSTLSSDTKFDAAICMWSTLGELPYESMLPRLKLLLKPKSIFIIDNKCYKEIPTGHRPPENIVTEQKGVTIKYTINDLFDSGNRIRNISYEIEGKVFKDTFKAILFTEASLEDLLYKHGFKLIEVYYDYSKIESTNTRRKQFVLQHVYNP